MDLARLRQVWSHKKLEASWKTHASCFVPLPHSSTHQPSGGVSTTTASASLDMLLMLCRRYAGHILVRGKLRNREELVVAHMMHDTLAPIVHVANIHFVVHCRGATAKMVGQNLVLRISCPDESGVPTSWPNDSYPLAQVETEECNPDDSKWHHASAISDLDSIWGFHIQSTIDTLSKDSSPANLVLAKAPGFGDLEVRQKLLEHFGIPTHAVQSLVLPRDVARGPSGVCEKCGRIGHLADECKMPTRRHKEPVASSSIAPARNIQLPRPARPSAATRFHPPISTSTRPPVQPAVDRQPPAQQPVKRDRSASVSSHRKRRRRSTSSEDERRSKSRRKKHKKKRKKKKHRHSRSPST